jgi:2',3'-cyclic-nucleotide 2'-phosphodiesterase/3'-nucleotidase/5'-nucleotidase
MLIRKKFPIILLAVCLIAFISAFLVPCDFTLAAAGDKVFDIIEITDFHGMLEDTKGNPVAAVMARNIKEIVDSNPERTLIVSGGDNYQGTILSNMLKGEPVMHFFNDIGVAVSVLGNHEFDWELDTVTAPGIANYPIICSNLFYKGTSRHVFEPYEIIEKDGVKIAVVGAVTEELPDIVLPGYIKDYDVGDIVDNVRQAARDARKKGAQIVIALIHAGDNLDSRTGPVFEVANQAGDVIDAVLGGHTHNPVNTTAANGTPVAIAGSYGRGFIDMKITRHQDGTLDFNTQYIAIDTDSTVFPYGYKALSPVVDQSVNDIIKNAKIKVGSVASQELGETDTGLSTTQADFPWGESTAGNWVCDVIKVKAGADFAFINNGALRIDIPQGAITLGALYSFAPFDNTIMTADMTGPQIKTLLEQAVGDGGKGIQVSGLTFTYDPSEPAGSRVVSIYLTDGTPINLTDTSKTYKVATNDYLATGDDGFTVFKDVTFINTNIPVRDALVENVQNAGRITARLEGRVENIQNANPYEPVTRAEFAGILVRILELTEDETAARFSDVPAGQKYAGAIGAAVKSGFVSGYGDGTFRPDKHISREEMTVMLIKSIEAAGYNMEVADVDGAIAGFNDINNISGWAGTSLAAAVEAGIIFGRESGDFDPYAHANRAEAAAVLIRAQNYIKSLN